MTFAQSLVRPKEFIIYLKAHLSADSFAHIPLPEEPNPYLRQADPDAIPDIYDIPIGLVNQVLFHGNES
jgi:hypothetical protein